MSKRNPNSIFNFNEPLESIERKIKGAFTGGRKNKDEQLKLGGNPKICMIYKMLMYHFEEEDEKLASIFELCITGKLMCGDHKGECVQKVLKFIEVHRKKKEKLIDKARELLKIN